MVNKVVPKSSFEDEFVPVLGETGQTIVYIFPDGNASVRKGKNPIAKQRAAQPAPPVQPLPPGFAAGADLGKQLLQMGIISATQLEVAKYDQRTSGLSLVEVLLARGWVTEEAIAPHLNAAP